MSKAPSSRARKQKVHLLREPFQVLSYPPLLARAVRWRVRAQEGGLPPPLARCRTECPLLRAPLISGSGQRCMEAGQCAPACVLAALGRQRAPKSHRPSCAGGTPSNQGGAAWRIFMERTTAGQAVLSGIMNERGGGLESEKKGLTQQKRGLLFVAGRALQGGGRPPTPCTPRKPPCAAGQLASGRGLTRHSRHEELFALARI